MVHRSKKNIYINKHALFTLDLLKIYFVPQFFPSTWDATGLGGDLTIPPGVMESVIGHRFRRSPVASGPGDHRKTDYLGGPASLSNFSGVPSVTGHRDHRVRVPFFYFESLPLRPGTPVKWLYVDPKSYDGSMLDLGTWVLEVSHVPCFTSLWHSLMGMTGVFCLLAPGVSAESGATPKPHTATPFESRPQGWEPLT